jgi:hypothetical protein
MKINNTNTNNTINTITDKQYTTYKKVYHSMWKLIDNITQSNYKNKRSAGFKMARSEAWNLVMNNEIKTDRKLYHSMWKIVDNTVNFENKKLRSTGFALARELSAKIAG